MSKPESRHGKLWRASLVTITGVMLVLGIKAHAATPANTVVQNQATATYTDVNSNSYTTQSNLASIKVKQIYSAELKPDNSVLAAAGQIIYFQHTLSNTGNGSDTYTVSVAQATNDGDTTAGNAAWNSTTQEDDADFTSLKVYHDVNANGQVDPGEPELTGASNTVALNAAEDASLVVEAQVPVSAADSTVGSVLSVSAGTGTVSDTGSNLDAADGTNHDMVTITNDAVLNVYKSYVYTPPATQGDTGSITFTINVTNTGTTPAKKVLLWDGMPANTSNPTGVTSTGFGSNTGDESAAAEAMGANGEGDLTGTATRDLNADGDTADATETDLGYDVNNDGDTADSLNGLTVIHGYDAELPVNTTVTFKYTVDVGTLAAGTQIKNLAAVCADRNDDGTVDDCTPSNEVVVSYPKFAATEVHDTGANESNGTNDGGDDLLSDGTNGETGTGNQGGETNTPDSGGGDIQYVNTAAAGSTVLFKVTVQNDGNFQDTFELNLANDAGAAFDAHGDTTTNLSGYLTGLSLVAGNMTPALSDLTPIAFQSSGGQSPTFTFWDAKGINELLDTTGDGRPDTGPIDSSGSKTILVKVKLPAGYSGTKLHAASVTTTSNYDNSVDDTAVVMVGAITAPSVDIDNSTADHSHGGAPNTYQAGDTPVTTKTGLPGQQVSFDLRITNNGGSPDAFQLGAGSSWDTSGSNGLGAMHSGWSVIFKDAACGSGGNTITTTNAIPAGNTQFLCAYVTISSDSSLALANRTATDIDNADGDDNATTGTDSVDGNSDSDEDYPIFFRVVSANSGASDIKLDAVDVSELELAACTPNNSGQVQPGGSIDYPHTLKNDGNTSETFSLSGSNSLSGFSHTILLRLDNDGSAGGTYTLVPWGLLTAGNSLQLNDGSLVSVASGPEVTLTSGQQLPVVVRVFAPSSASNGSIDANSLSASYNSGGSTASCSNNTTVILGQLRLRKYVALDAGCDGTPDEALKEIASSDVEPTQCATWQVVATNEGDAAINDVILYDAAPAYTTYQTGTLMGCLGNATLDTAGSGCTNGNITDAAMAFTDADDAETHNDSLYANHDGSGNVTFYVGSSATGQNSGGTIQPGESVTVRFSTKVD